jgi:DNA-binding MarR family transcriptional regulator
VHGRVLQWTLTRRGLTLLEKCRHPAMALEQQLVAGLDARTLAAIRRWLAKIATDLQDS